MTRLEAIRERQRSWTPLSLPQVVADVAWLLAQLDECEGALRAIQLHNRNVDMLNDIKPICESCALREEV